MRVLPALLAVILFSVPATAEEWTRIESADSAVSMEYSKESIQPVSSTIKKARTRFISTTDQNIPVVNVHSVVSDLEFHCIQPLEKVVSVEVVPSAGAAPILQKPESPVFHEIRHGSNSFRLWLQICSRLSGQGG